MTTVHQSVRMGNRTSRFPPVERQMVPIAKYKSRAAIEMLLVAPAVMTIQIRARNNIEMIGHLKANICRTRLLAAPHPTLVLESKQERSLLFFFIDIYGHLLNTIIQDSKTRIIMMIAWRLMEIHGYISIYRSGLCLANRKCPAENENC